MKILAVCGAQGAMIYKLRRFLVANVEPRAVFHTKDEEQWKLNFGETPFVRTLEELDESTTEELDLIIGSPSCGHSSRFSYSRKKTLGNPREDPTMNLFLDSVSKLRPQLFMMENLPKLLDLIPTSVWEEKFSEYELTMMQYPVSVFGNSQTTRKRLVLVGKLKKSRKYRELEIKPFLVRSGPSTYTELLKRVRKDLDFREDDGKKLSMYHHSDKTKTTLTVAQVKALWQGEFNAYNRWPMFGHKMNTLPGVYRNKVDSYPLTLRPSNRQFNPDGTIMGLEIFRVIMGFPKRYRLYFDEKQKTYWLNKGRNALTKGSVAEVGLWAYHLLRPYLSD